MSDNTSKLSRFTFFIEKEGSTIIEQFDGIDVEDATLRWFHESETQPGEPLEDNPPTAVQQVANVWCTAGHDPQGIFFLVHIVATQLNE